MARIRPVKRQTTDKNVRLPEPATGSAGAGASGRSGRSSRPRPTGEAKVAKTGSVTKAVQPSRASRFLREVVAELRKVTWPTRSQLFQATAVVIVAVAVVALYLGVCDALFRRLVHAIF
jgi:preprotein translocase subunit SecE